jgi:hypothetical protein
MEPDDLLCSHNARPQKVGRKGVRSFLLLPERAPYEGPRSTAAVESSSRPCLAGFELEKKVQMETRRGRSINLHS